MISELRYHATILAILELNMNYDWEKASNGLQRHEARIKSPDCFLHAANVRWMVTVQKYYFKNQCCSLLQRSLELYLKNSKPVYGWKTKAARTAAAGQFTKQIRIQELIMSLERIYNHFETVKDWQHTL